MVEIIHLTKRYPDGKAPAVDDVSLTIGTGEFFGLLGPNGAGKTTLISVLSTLLLPTAGEVRIDGERLTRGRADVKRKLALVTQHNSLRGNMTPEEILELQGRLYYMDRRRIRERSDELLAFCGLAEHRGRIVRQISGGMKRKLMICRALLTQPEVLILDEPTVGLDPASRRQIWDLLRTLNREGMTILLTTHYIEEAEQLCGRVAMIESGRIARLAPPRELICALGAFAIDEFDGEHTKSTFFQTREEALRYAEGLSREFAIRSTTLEDVFLSEVGRGLGAQA